MNNTLEELYQELHNIIENNEFNRKKLQWERN